MSTSARLLISAAPELWPEAKKYVVDCKHSTSTLYFAPGPIDLPEAHRVSIWVDRLHGEIQERQVARHLAGRRN